MNVKLKILRKVLEEAINNIDAGNSNHSDDELDDIISSLTKLNRGIKRISKREACERILHCSPSTFDNYIKLGLIPRGHKEYGFKELNWSEKDFDKATLARIKKYNVFSGVEIGGGTIKINIPSFDKQLVFDYNDIETFKQNILN